MCYLVGERPSRRRPKRHWNDLLNYVHHVQYGGVFFLGIFFIFFGNFFRILLFCFGCFSAFLLLLLFCFCCFFAFAALLLLLLFCFCCCSAFAALLLLLLFLLLLPFCFCCLSAFVACLLLLLCFYLARFSCFAYFAHFAHFARKRLGGLRVYTRYPGSIFCARVFLVLRCALFDFSMQG